RCTNSRLLPTCYAVCVSALRAWARGSTPPVASPPAEVVASQPLPGRKGPVSAAPLPPGPKARHKCVTVQ
ncbi:MAG: hypothetical protein KDA99_27455, partial [Planctomycetales bacterium]|nr:hypothetical protein [Planctomycetales bacterium]